jgi:hypothetical protein
MFLIEISQTKPRKHAAFCYGRVNPPTIGHARLFNTTARASMGGDYYIFLSHTQDPEKNPLDYYTKVDFVKAIYPQHADHVSTGMLKGIMPILEFLYHHNYTDVTFVCGNDRLPTFTKLLNDYNGLEGKPTYFKFNSINVVSSGPRDPDKDDDVAGVSASAARLAAKEGKFEKFKEITGAGRHAKQLYRAVRRGMNVVNEDAAGVGVVATNKKMAKDPRYSTSMTADVRPNTPQKNLKAFKLA